MIYVVPTPLNAGCAECLDYLGSIQNERNALALRPVIHGLQMRPKKEVKVLSHFGGATVRDDDPESYHCNAFRCRVDGTLYIDLSNIVWGCTLHAALAGNFPPGDPTHDYVNRETAGDYVEAMFGICYLRTHLKAAGSVESLSAQMRDLYPDYYCMFDANSWEGAMRWSTSPWCSRLLILRSWLEQSGRHVASIIECRNYWHVKSVSELADMIHDLRSGLSVCVSTGRPL